MNAFQRHGITHLSPSSCNAFLAQQAMWVAERLLDRKSPVGAAAHRGTAIEAGVTMGLLDPKADLAHCIKEGEGVFRTKTAFSTDPKKEKEFAAVAPSIEIALTELRPYGPDVECQRKISWQCDTIPVPFIGYIDFIWPDHGILIDLKTQLRLASEIKRGHARQVALYKAATSDNMDARITYVTPKKSATYGLENHQYHLKSLIRIGETMGRFLALSDDPLELKDLTLPDLDTFWWNDQRAQANARELWSM